MNLLQNGMKHMDNKHVCSSEHQACYLCVIRNITCKLYPEKKRTSKDKDGQEA